MAAGVLQHRSVRAGLPAQGCGQCQSCHGVDVERRSETTVPDAGPVEIARIRVLGLANGPRRAAIAGGPCAIRILRDLANTGWAASAACGEILQRRTVRRARSPACDMSAGKIGCNAIRCNTAGLARQRREMIGLRFFGKVDLVCREDFGTNW